MKSAPPGNDTLDVEVSSISGEGFRLLLDGAELYVPFSEFPWFRGAPVAKLRRVERPRAGHLRWPELDIDLAVESIRHPEKFPLVAR